MKHLLARVGETIVETLKHIDAGELNVAYVEGGAGNAPVAILLHGWPYDITSYAAVVPVLVAAGYRVIVPFLRGYGPTRFRSAAAFRNGQQSIFAVDTIALMDALGIQKAVIGGFDWGARAANIMAAAWPERCAAIVSASGYLIIDRAANQRPIAPKDELGWWYQYYFATARGKAGYAANTHDFNRLIWTLASPKWAFGSAEYERTAAAFSNPDHVAIVIHNYRWRLGLEAGDPQYDALEGQLAQRPPIGVPAVTIGSDFDGAAADGASYARLFSGPHLHRVLPGTGHNVPQENPRAFAAAIVDAGNLR